MRRSRPAGRKGYAYQQTIGPANADGRYLGFLIPQEAFALSRNPIFVLLGDRSRKTLDSFLRETAGIGSSRVGTPRI